MWQDFFASGFSSLSHLDFHTLFKSLGIFYLFILFFKGAPGAPGPDGLTGTKGSMVSDVKCIKFMRKVLHVYRVEGGKIIAVEPQYLGT